MITARSTTDPREGDDPRIAQIRLRALIKRRKALLNEEDFALILMIRRVRSATIEELDPCL